MWREFKNAGYGILWWVVAFRVQNPFEVNGKSLELV
jgi:hypothetical protein